MSRTLFKDFLSSSIKKGEYSTDDTIAFVLPLFRTVLELHETGLVAPFERENSLFVTDGILDIDKTLAHPPVEALYRVQALFPRQTAHGLEITNPQEPATLAAYQPGYHCFEHEAGHHDPQTDIFCLGLLLASTALGLDLYDRQDLQLFIRARTNPAQQNPRIHPTISRLITETTMLDRSRRSQDLYDIIVRLEHYRDYDPEKQADLSNIAGWLDKTPKDRNGFILNKLRNRLFDISRRNRLLYYKPNLRFVNLTVSSVPAVLHYQSIRPDLLFTWQGQLAKDLVAGKEILLNKYLRFEDHAWLPSSLDRVRVEARRDLQEYGFSQLKLVIAFMNWHNLKENNAGPDGRTTGGGPAAERIQTPLLLLPVALKKNKKLKEDHYVLKVLDNTAEVNPVLAGLLRELYGIRLPDLIDLDEMSPEQFYLLLKTQIESSNQGIFLHYIDKPRIYIEPAAPSEPAPSPEQTPPPEAITSETEKPSEQPPPSEPAPPTEQVTETDTRQRVRYALVPGDNDPHIWDIDVCNIVLGNFHYKKMSLVRDYNTVIDRQQTHPTFDALFSEQPRSYPEIFFDGSHPDDWFHVVTADPTQTRAIQQSRSGYSYIIQGPPGTGKSQTITNLIADFLARGKNILFVCEKRAALDVVYHRLKQVGLEELCCYIHDSQGDKREFIKNLKTTYEDFIETRMDLAALRQSRENLLHNMHRSLELLREFHDTGMSADPATGVTIHELTETLISLREELVPLSAAQEEELPSYDHWQTARPVLTELELVLDDTEPGSVFSTHPFSHIKDAIVLSTSPYRALETALQEALKALDETGTLLETCRLEPQYLQDTERIKNLVQFAVLLYPLARTGNMALADPDREESKEMEHRFLIYRQQQETYRQATQKNSRWLQKPDEYGVDSALNLAARYEHAFLGKLNSPWRKLKHQLQQSYDFSAHSVRPSYEELLRGLKTEYSAAAQLSQTRQQLEEHYRLGQNIDTARLSIEMLQSRKGHPDLEYLLRHPDGPALVSSLQAVQQPMNRLETALNRCLETPPAGSLASVRDELLNIQLNLDSLPDWLPALIAFAGLPADIKTTVRRLPLRMKQIEAAIVRKALQKLYQTHRGYATIDGQALEKAVLQLADAYPALQELNAKVIRAFVRQKFLHQLELSNRAASQLNDEQKKFKRSYAEGRKILENEFGKTMRYKSIRELSEKESGLVLKTLKPVWLMSPYSVSDSLPLDGDYFDVVIFDEASQITLEEGIPALHRSRQTIIVGDEKQMPPTDFFSAGSKDKDPDDLGTSGSDDDEWLTEDADSLLAQAARKLESTLLSWHYRSHYETLISFSNHAFYGGELLTIPEKIIHHAEKNPIRIARPEDASDHAASFFDRSIGYHLLTDSIYEKRSNPAEALYIARLIRELLRRRIPESIGIVAFSQEQQRAIESALDTLAAEDAGFAQQLEEAYNRTENDQFVGLIIKNLENIQGDERDIIIISVCYGPDNRRRMLMNFGPVNKKGGEKRLNVLFSRARKHMAVVSSIRYDQITNEYNEGASYLRRFLQYAELVSSGQMENTRTILDSLVADRTDRPGTINPTIIRTQLKEQLTALGYEVAGPIGQSDFKCSLAVKKEPGDQEYALAILIDDEEHYRNENLVELYYQRPAILRNFGWKVLPVYAKDWLHQPQKVLELILRILRDEPMASLQAHVADTQTAHLAFRRLIHAQTKTFWEAATDGNKLVVRWGRTGTRGQTRIKTFPDETTAQNELDSLEGEQKEKGYEPDQEPR